MEQKIKVLSLDGDFVVCRVHKSVLPGFYKFPARAEPFCLVLSKKGFKSLLIDLGVYRSFKNFDSADCLCILCEGDLR